MLEKIEQFVTRGRHAADPERHGPNRESFGETHPESMRLLGAERAEAAAPARRAETGFVGRDDRRRSGEPHGEHPPFAPRQGGRHELECGRRESGSRDVFADLREILTRALEHVGDIRAGSARSRRCTSTMTPKAPNPPAWSRVR